jgi:hypothetical protein
MRVQSTTPPAPPYEGGEASGTLTPSLSHEGEKGNQHKRWVNLLLRSGTTQAADCFFGEAVQFAHGGGGVGLAED